MRRFAYRVLAALTLAAAVAPAQVGAQSNGQNNAQNNAQTNALPPHAWLFGTWTGGIFPAPTGISNQACLSQPVVIFSRDLVLRATITEQVLIQREIETARTSANGAEFRFAATGGRSGLLGSFAPTPGFGCEGPDVLHVQRRGDNEIFFPGCADFPNPLVRCQTR